VLFSEVYLCKHKFVHVCKSVHLFVSLYLNLHIVECCVIDRSYHSVIWEFEGEKRLLYPGVRYATEMKRIF